MDSFLEAAIEEAKAGLTEGGIPGVAIKTIDFLSGKAMLQEK